MPPITVRSYTADRALRAELVGPGEVTLQFKPETYPRLDEATLAERLTELAERLTAGCREARRRRAVAKGLTVETEPHWDAEVRRYRALRDRMPVRWTTPSGELTLACRGLRNWRVTLKPGVTRRLSEAAFATEVRLAASGLAWEHKRRLALLRRRRREGVLPG